MQVFIWFHICFSKLFYIVLIKKPYFYILYFSTVNYSIKQEGSLGLNFYAIYMQITYYISVNKTLLISLLCDLYEYYLYIGYNPFRKF